MDWNDDFFFFSFFLPANLQWFYKNAFKNALCHHLFLRFRGVSLTLPCIWNHPILLHRPQVTVTSPAVGPEERVYILSWKPGEAPLPDRFEIAVKRVSYFQIKTMIDVAIFDKRNLEKKHTHVKCRCVFTWNRSTAKQQIVFFVMWRNFPYLKAKLRAPLHLVELPLLVMLDQCF